MNITKCKIFLKTAETGSFTKTAKQLGYTQSAVSQAIQSLEDSIGLKLFNREKSPITLTPEGRELLPFFKNIYDAYDSLFTTIRSIENIDSGNISIGCAPSFASFCLPDLICMFSKKYPNVTYEFFSGGSDKITEKVRNGDLDFGIIYGKNDNDFYTVKLFDFIPVILSKTTDYGTLSDAAFATFDGNDEFSLLSSQFERKGLKLSTLMTASDISQLVFMVNSGLACGVLPDFAGPSLPAGICSDNEKASFKIPVSVIFKNFHEISRTGKCFLDLLAETYC